MSTRRSSGRQALEQARGRARVGDVELQRERVGAEALDHRREALEPAAGADHLHAPRGELLGDRRADAAAGARDQRHRAGVQDALIHGSALLVDGLKRRPERSPRTNHAAALRPSPFSRARAGLSGHPRRRHNVDGSEARRQGGDGRQRVRELRGREPAAARRR